MSSWLYCIEVEKDEPALGGPVKEWVRVGLRKTRSGAERLLEKHIGRVYGFQMQKDGSLVAGTKAGRGRLREGWFDVEV